MRGVRFIEEKCADKHEHDKRERAINDNRLAQLAIVHAHERKHSGNAEDQPDGLAQQKIIRMAIVVFGRDSGSAVNHHGAEQTEAQRYAKQPTIALRASRHLAHLFPKAAGPEAEWAV